MHYETRCGSVECGSRETLTERRGEALTIIRAALRGDSIDAPDVELRTMQVAATNGLPRRSPGAGRQAHSRDRILQGRGSLGSMEEDG